MSLPKLKVPTYETELPSTNETVSYRPFLVSDEKILLLAMKSDDTKLVVKELIRVIDNCVTFPKKSKYKKAEDLTIVDLEWLFLQLRSNSIGELVEPTLTCSKCNAPQPVAIDIGNAYHQKGEVIKVIMLDEKEQVGITLIEPGSDIAIKYSSEVTDDQIFDIVIDCIDTVIDGDTIHLRKDLSRYDIEDFVNNLQAEHFKKIQTWFESMPKIKLDVTYTCLTCKEDNKITLTGLQDFFGSLSAMKALRGSTD